MVQLILLIVPQKIQKAPQQIPPQKIIEKIPIKMQQQYKQAPIKINKDSNKINKP